MSARIAEIIKKRNLYGSHLEVKYVRSDNGEVRRVTINDDMASPKEIVQRVRTDIENEDFFIKRKQEQKDLVGKDV